MGFKEMRIKANLTQAQITEKLGIPQSTIASWETGIAKPRASKLPQLAELFNCTVDDLLREDEEALRKEAGKE